MIGGEKIKAGSFLKYTLITASNAAWSPDALTKKLVINIAPGAAAGGSGANGADAAWSGGAGAQGGNTSFGSFTIKATDMVGTGGAYTGGNGSCAGYQSYRHDICGGLTAAEMTGVTNGEGGRGADSKFGLAGKFNIARASAIGAGAYGGVSQGNGGGAGGGSAASPVEQHIINNPSGTYVVVIGAGGLQGYSSHGQWGQIGGQGFVEVWEYA